MLGISTSLTLKCRNLSLGYPNEMIPIHNENGLMDISLFRRKYEKIMAHVSP